jgi:CheY-like chemotaxis protein
MGTVPRTTATMTPVRVLMADDDIDEQMIMTLAGEHATVPIELSFVDNGVQLMRRLNDLRSLDQLPDVVLLDLRMPLLEGHRVLQELTNHPELRHVPVVVMTNSRRKRDVNKSYMLGAHHYETKSSDFAHIVEFVEWLAAYADAGVSDGVATDENAAAQRGERERPPPDVADPWAAEGGFTL